MTFQEEDKMIEYYKTRIGYFYQGLAKQISFAMVDEEIRSTINRAVAMKTDNAIENFMHHEHPHPAPPMAVYAANYFKVRYNLYNNILYLVQ